jgi:acyl carrier protein
VDYFNLPAPSRERFAEIPYEEPGSPVERRLAEIFSEVLGIARIGRWDDFFQLGGHSLLAAQVSARIRQRFNIGLELRSFLEAPSVEALARRLESLGSASPNRRAALAAQDREEIEL